MLKQDDHSFVADENFDFAIVRQLRDNGFPVIAIAESFSSIPDTQVLQIAFDRRAILLTEDKDFGELVHRLRMNHCDSLLVRLLKMDSAEKSRRVMDVLMNQGNELVDSFSVLNNEQLRIRPAK